MANGWTGNSWSIQMFTLGTGIKSDHWLGENPSGYTTNYYYWKNNLVNCLQYSILCKIWLNHYIQFIYVPSHTAAILHVQTCIKVANWGRGLNLHRTQQQGSSKYIFIKTNAFPSVQYNEQSALYFCFDDKFHKENFRKLLNVYLIKSSCALWWFPHILLSAL